MTTITRMGLCRECYKADRPKLGQMFIAYGATSDKFKIMYAAKDGQRGFVPHIYELIKTLEGEISFQKICCMEGCGTFLKKTDGTDYLAIDKTKWIFGTMPVSDWNALVMDCKDIGLEI